jgi:glucose/arabinose dehydrogenase
MAASGLWSSPFTNGLMRTPLLLAILSLAAASGGFAQSGPACVPDNAGLTLPSGFCAVLVGENLGAVRHFVVAPNGDIFAAVAGSRDGTTKGGLYLMRDSDGDGKADVVRAIHETGGTGVALAPGAVYFAPNDQVLRFPWAPGALEPSAPAEVVVSGLPTGGHSAKTITIGSDGALYVTIGSRTNSCQEKDRTSKSAGVNPCVELEERAGIWRFDARRTGQTQADGVRFATGLRNAMAKAVEPSTGVLFMATHGRDQLTENWGFPAEEGRENPAEQFGPVRQGGDYGWPYCYYDPRQQAKVQAPEYGGDGRKVGDCARYDPPAIGFPAHWAPMAIAFYTGTAFPAEYRGGAFLSFHGSWNRGPGPEYQAGYRVVFIPFADGNPTGKFRDFALPAGAHNAVRPAGLAVGPDGSLYIGSDAQQKIWRVFYRP